MAESNQNAYAILFIYLVDTEEPFLQLMQCEVHISMLINLTLNLTLQHLEVINRPYV